MTEETEHKEEEHHCPHCEDIAQLKESVTTLVGSIAHQAEETADAAYQAIGELFGVDSE